MKYSQFKRLTWVPVTLLFVFILASCQKDQPVDPALSEMGNLLLSKKHKPSRPDTLSIFATGLNNPRGLEFGKDGDLFVAEGGLGGDSINHFCDTVPFPVGPYSGSKTGARISKISPSGNRTTVADSFPSSQTNPASGSFVSGVSDVAFLDGNLYALISGAGCSHGLEGTFNGIARINSDGSWHMIANLSDFWRNHPVAHPEPDDFEPDGTPYSMVVIDHHFYVVEPNHGEIDRVSRDGSIGRIVDISRSQGHIVPTSIAYNHRFYVGNLGTFPIVPGTERILRFKDNGKLKVSSTGLTAVLGVAFDQKIMYVLETSTAPGFPTPGTGMVLRVGHGGRLDTIATGLTFPTGMAFGPDHALYISNFGFGFPPGAGQIVRVKVPADKHHEDGDENDNEDGDQNDNGGGHLNSNN